MGQPVSFLRSQAEALVREAAADLSLGAAEIHALVKRVRDAAALSRDALLEAEAFALLGGHLAPSTDPFEDFRQLQRASNTFLAHGQVHKAADCRLACAGVLLHLGLERRSVMMIRQVLAEFKLTTNAQAQAHTLLGLCHSHLGEIDLALQILNGQATTYAALCPRTPRTAHVLWVKGLTGIRLMIWHHWRELWRGWPDMPSIATPPQSPTEIAALFERALAQLPSGQRWPYLDMGRQFALGLGMAPETALKNLADMALERTITDPPFVARALYCQALIHRRHSQPEQALRCLLECLAVAEQVDSLSIVRDASLQLSRVYEELDRMHEALDTYKRFAKFRLRSLLPTDPVELGQPAPASDEAISVNVLSSQAFGDVHQVEPRYLRWAVQFIHQGVGRPLSVQDVVMHCEVSRRTLEMAFRKHRLEGLSRYIKRQQLAYAADQLRQTGASVQAVGELIGYRSPTAFAREFRKQFGQSPAAWRRSAGEGLPPAIQRLAPP